MPSTRHGISINNRSKHTFTHWIRLPLWGRHWLERAWRTPETLVQAANVARVADEGELVRLGFLNGAAPGVSWRPLHKGQAATILERFDEWVEYRGMFQGLIHSLYKEAQPPYFDLRDFATGKLVKCQFESSAYKDVVVALKRKTAWFSFPDGSALNALTVASMRLGLSGYSPLNHSTRKS